MCWILLSLLFDRSRRDFLFLLFLSSASVNKLGFEHDMAQSTCILVRQPSALDVSYPNPGLETMEKKPRDMLHTL